jgi:hypothetical protein
MSVECSITELINFSFMAHTIMLFLTRLLVIVSLMSFIVTRPCGFNTLVLWSICFYVFKC